MIRALLLALTALLSACTAFPDPPPGYQFACRSTADCADGHTCTGGCCVAEGEAPTCGGRLRSGLGDPCTDTCRNGHTCLSEASSGLPGGSCVQSCGCTGVGCCGDNAGCAVLNGLRGTQVLGQPNGPGNPPAICLVACSNPSDSCRAGWRCSCKVAPGCFCIPDCNAPGGGCQPGFSCDAETGLCEPPDAGSP